MGEGRKLLSEELHDVYFLLCNRLMYVCTCKIESTQVNWPGHELRMGQKRNACRILVGKLQRNRPVGRPRLRKEDNININSKCIEY
jgi:hypothetical protein